MLFDALRAPSFRESIKVLFSSAECVRVRSRSRALDLSVNKCENSESDDEMRAGKFVSNLSTRNLLRGTPDPPQMCADMARREPCASSTLTPCTLPHPRLRTLALTGAAAASASDLLFEATLDSGASPFVLSRNEKYAGQEASIAVQRPTALEGHDDADLLLTLTKEAQHYGLTAPLRARVSLADDKPLVLQYEVKTQNGMTCGGSYVKLYEESVDVDTVSSDSPYLIMFGALVVRAGRLCARARFMWRGRITPSPPHSFHHSLPHLTLFRACPLSRARRP